MGNDETIVETQDALLARHATERAQLERVESLARTMDAAFTIPGTNIPLGLDTIVGLVPGIGDTVSLGIAGYIMSHGVGLKAKKHHMARMGWNIFLDWLIGLVPVIGDLLDIGWRGNLRNAALLRQITEDRWMNERAEVGIIDHAA
ncbi:MAG: DUF4112 domain-containing protein [Litorimonas sp.]